MTRDEAVNVIEKVLDIQGGIDPVGRRRALSLFILDAIGFDQMQAIVIASKKVKHETTRVIQATDQEVSHLKKERDEARELAKRLAASLKDSGAEGHPAHTYQHVDCGLCAEEAVLTDFESASKDW